jgi:2-methylcitrate dehydratase PrpD
LAGRGVTGPERALEGGYGFYACFTAGEFDRDVLTGELAHRWEAEDLRYKPYPSNYYTHAGIDAARSLRRQGLDVGRVETIRQLVASPMLRTMGSPLDAKRRPRDGYAAKFSGPYTVAAALLGGGGLGLGVDDFRDALVTDSARVRLMDRITVHADRRCDEVFPDHAPCVLEIHTKDGHVWREEVWENRGSAQNPLDSAEVASKFFDNTRRTMPQESAERLNEQLRSLPEAPHVRDVTALLSSPHVR